MDKSSIPPLVALLACRTVCRGRLRAARPLRGIDVLLIIALLGVLGTVFTNGDALHDGVVTRQPMELYDAISTAIGFILTCYLPFLVGRAVFRTGADAQDFLRCFVIAGLIYTPLLLIEVRFSPQLHTWVYGFFPHSFAQTRRGGGFRPVVFMGHGLIVGRFMLGVVIAAALVWKAKLKRPTRVANGAVVVLLIVVTVLCKSLGSLMLAVIALPLIFFTKPQTQVRVAAIVGLITLTYPVLRLTDNFPVDDLLDFSASFSEDRASSLEFRFVNEDQLLERALERPVFGWGGYSRNRVLNEAGKDLSVTDGEWIILFGIYGVIGFVGQFGLFVLPLLIAARNIKRIQSVRDRSLVGGIALMNAVFAADPNSQSSGVFPHFFVAGILHGLATGMVLESARKPATVALARPRQGMPGDQGAVASGAPSS